MAVTRPRSVVLVDEIAAHEGVTSNLRSSGRQFHTIRLAELPSWRDAIKVFDSYDVTGVIAKFSITVLTRVGDANHARDVNELIDRVAPLPHVVFMSQGIYTGDAMRRAEEDASRVLDRDSTLRVQEVMVANTLLTPDGIQKLKRGVDFIKNSPLRVVVARNDAEITVAAEQFVREAEKGLLFRAYLPSGRIWETEFDRLLTLFKDFLVRVANADVRLEQNRTPYGVSYAFFGDGITPQQVAADFEEFTSLLDITVTDPKAAEDILSSRYAMAEREIANIITRYAKEARRLQIDIRHDREQKLLSIRQQFESELYDTVPELDLRQVERIIDETLPQSLDLIPTGRRSMVFNLFDNSQISFHFTEQHIARLDGIVAHAIHGNIDLTHDERQFVDAIEKHGGADKRELTTALYQLRDPGTADAERVTAGQRLRTFLLQLAQDVHNIAVGVLQTYIEKKLGF